ncbi:MAG: agmatinase [Dethiobacteria bacterium]|jgi:agmatinase|nr:agmatinase [Bacillota bacterium]
MNTKEGFFCGLEVVQDSTFLGASADFQAAKVVLLGVPLDQTTSYRAGTNQGPEEIRNVSQVLEDYSLYLRAGFSPYTFYDCGDLLLPRGNLNKSLQLIENAVEKIIEAGKVPLLIGGEHLLTFPTVKALYRRYPRLVILHFDAHADLRDTYLAEKLSHATVMRRVLELGAVSIYQFGIRSATAEEEKVAEQFTYFYPYTVKENLKRCLPRLKGSPVYITFDIDLIDPGFAPGTGTPEPGGISPHELFSILPLLRELKIVGFDLVELSPPYDNGQITAVLAAKIIREIILLISLQQQA